VLRPLFYHFPDDTTTYALHDEVLLGPSLLAAPVYQPGRTYRTVYLPAGEWFDWWTDTPISGPTHVLAHAPLERMPLYVRAGAIIPLGPEMRYTDEKPLDPLTLEVYPGEGALTLYEDDGETFAYQQGTYCTTQIHMQHSTRSTGGADEGSTGSRKEEGLLLQIGARTGAYNPPPRQLIIRLHGVGAMAARDYPGAQYSPDQRLLLLQFADDGSARELWFPLA
jgi:alpha-glucosidase